MIVLAKAGVTPRDARTLAPIGNRLHPLLESQPKIRFPYRIRTLSSLADLSAETLAVAADSGLIHPAMTDTEARDLRGATGATLSSVIRPTDNWISQLSVGLVLMAGKVMAIYQATCTPTACGITHAKAIPSLTP